LSHYRREREAVAELTASLLELAEQYRLWFKDFCWAMRSWAEGDIERLTKCIEAILGSGNLLDMTYWSSLIAELQADRGQHEAAAERLDECLRLAAATGETYYVPELYRLKAASYLARETGALQGALQAEECLRRSIAAAREQGARALELRSTLALCRLLREQGRREEARVLLSESGGWPAEDSAPLELAEMRALLGEPPT
jgi:hypothetical protein